MLFPDIDVAAGTITFAIWQPVILIGLLLLLLLLAIYRAPWAEALPNVVGPVVRVSLILLAIAAAWTLLDRTAERDRADERRALDRRITELSARAAAPGSPLGCLETSLGETIAAACEKAIFASPETVAAANAYVAAGLSLLSDGVANGVDAEYDAALAGLRRKLQIDQFGFVAQVLAGEGCSATNCEKFALFADASRVSAHLKARTFDQLVARHSASWPQPALAAAPPAAPVTPPASIATAPPPNPAASGNGINFPSAASIPPVSIMTNEPTEPTTQGGTPPATGPAAAAQKRPAAPARPPARAQAPPAPPPIQIGPPAANAGTEPPPQ